MTTHHRRPAWSPSDGADNAEPTCDPTATNGTPSHTRCRRVTLTDNDLITIVTALAETMLDTDQPDSQRDAAITALVDLCANLPPEWTITNPTP